MTDLLLFSAAISSGYISMIIRFVINLIVVGILVHCLYFPKSRRREFYFTFQLVGIAIFFLVFFMMFVLEDMKGKTSIGIGIGLFGIFSIMRYRTETMPVREMTYLFMIIALSVINALSEPLSYVEIGITNVIFILATWYFEGHFFISHVETKLIQYDRIDLVTPDKRDELKADLEKRTGLDIIRIEVGGMDFLKDSAVIKITYEPQDHHRNSVDNQFKVKNEK